MKNNKIFSYKISYKTTNVLSFINKCKDIGVEINSIQKVSSNNLKFCISEDGLRKLKKQDFFDVKNAEFECLGGVNKILNFCILKMGVLFGFVVVLILYIVFSGKILNIQIIGNNTILKSDIVKVLNANDMGYMTTSNINTTKVNEILTKTYNISLVSSIIKGNTLIINIKEENCVDEKFVGIVAEENLIIKSIKVYAGTTKFKVGDLVKKGEVVVEPFYYENEQKVSIKPNADIVCTTIYSSSYLFKNSYSKVVKTGRSKIINSTFELGKFKLKSFNRKNPYSNFVIENKNILISKYFLPLKIIKTIAYETKEIVVEQDFEKCKNNILNKLKNEVINKLPVDIVDNTLTEDINISKVSEGYWIGYNISVDRILRYN